MICNAVVFIAVRLYVFANNIHNTGEQGTNSTTFKYYLVSYKQHTTQKINFKIQL